MEQRNTFPDIYIMSKFVKLSTELKKYLPETVNIFTIHVPNLNTNGIIEVSEETIRTLEDAEILITDPGPHLADFLYRLPHIKWVQICRAGVEVIFSELDQHKLPPPQFTMTRYVDSNLGDLMANYVLAQIVNMERNLFQYHDEQKLRKWARPNNYSSFRTLCELTVGILGAGTMGSAVGEFLKKCGCKVICFVRHERKGPSKSYDEAVIDLQVILKESDYICNSLPSTKHTKGLLDNDMLKNCKRKPVFMNIGRGDIIKTSSITKALQEGWISKAVLDVLEKEPLPPEDPLWNMPDVHITPHIGALPKYEYIAKLIADNYLRYANGDNLLNVVEWEEGY